MGGPDTRGSDVHLVRRDLYAEPMQVPRYAVQEPGLMFGAMSQNAESCTSTPRETLSDATFSKASARCSISAA